jgi:hypothetical protein
MASPSDTRKPEKVKGDKVVKDPGLAARFVTNLTGKVSDELMENRERKVAEPMDELFEEAQRLARLRIDNETFLTIHAGLTKRLKEAEKLSEKKKFEELEKIKLEARKAAKLAPLAVAWHMAADECERLLKFLDDEIRRLQEANLKPDALTIKRKINDFRRECDDALNLIKADAPTTFEAKDKAFQAIRAKLRIEVPVIQDDVTKRLESSIALDQLKDEAEQAYSSAFVGVQKVQQKDVLQQLQTRLQECRKLIDKATTADNKPIDLRKAAKDARAICAVAKPGRITRQ